MTTDKDFKRLVRGRMQKTGEAYTAARAQLRTQKPAARSTAAPAPIDYAKLAGRSDAILKTRTGCTWERWVKALDGVEAHTWTHTEIARHVHEKYKIPGWWAQTVTVGYAYPAVWLLPLAFLLVVPMVAGALTRDLAPA